MKYTSITLTFLLLSGVSVAYQDYDIDGVEDSIDSCPNTPFDILVNDKGCPDTGEKTTTTADNYGGNFTFKVGTDISTDETYESDNSLNLYANYAYRNWDISASNSRSTTNNSTYTEDNSYGNNDIYLATGYMFSLPSSQLKLSVGTKIADSEESTTISSRQQGRFNTIVTEESIASRDNDYFASMNFNYLLNPKQDLFFYLGHTLSGDSSDTDYEDYSSFSVGTGYAINKSWYSAVSYNYTGSIYTDGDPEQGLAWFNSYNFSKNLFATAAYNYALEDFSYDHTFSLALGVHF